tara:strand:- start:113 stop:232 length:120 start_codon:yes stop_codon:yes gene_type:complete
MKKLLKTSNRNKDKKAKNNLKNIVETYYESYSQIQKEGE